MAQFDESKVINALHPEKAEIGKKYWFSDSIGFLKVSVESNSAYNVFVLGDVKDGNYPFEEDGYDDYKQFLYPYEEPPKQRMTYRQFCEWFNRGNGQWKWKDSLQCHTDYSYPETRDNEEVYEDIHIRSWDSEDWIEPTVDIYERDCRGGKE